MHSTLSGWETNADGSAVCPHRDMSVCPDCVLTPPEGLVLLDALGARYLMTPGQRDEYMRRMADID